VIKSRRMRWTEHKTLVREMRKGYTFSLRKSERKRQLGYQDLHKNKALRWDLKSQNMRSLTELNWIVLGSSGRCFGTLQCNFGFHKRQGIFRLPEILSTSQKRKMFHSYISFLNTLTAHQKYISSLQLRQTSHDKCLL
jgi:hypothetical protein